MAITDESRTATGRPVPIAMRDLLRVPRERYYDREFFELGKEHLWPRVWHMVGQQRGVHSRGYREHRLATEMERAISNMHMELDRYLSR